jgi:GNAT superfamily N-acetyltransferase
MQVSFRRTTDVQALRAMHSLILPSDEVPALNPNVAAWLGWAKGTPVAFCTARYWRSEGSVFLERAGVLPIAQGNGLQRRMIRLREKWAKQQGAECVLTYVEARNYESLVNLLRCRYRLYEPANPWGIEGGHYFRKELDASAALG